ncbi:hypothetical protein ACLMJK_008929 [Lecanora helva]
MDLKRRFWRHKQSAARGDKTKSAKASTSGAHELFLEYEGFLSAPSSRSARPSTSAAKPEQGKTAGPHQSSKASRREAVPHDKSLKHFHDSRDVVDEARPPTQRSSSQRSKGLFALNHSSVSPRNDLSKKHLGSTASQATEPAPVNQTQHTSWFRRCTTSSSRDKQPPPASSFAAVPPYLDYCEDELTALPPFPGYENDPPRVLEKPASGAAARAAAAAQNEIIDSMRNFRIAEPMVTRDSESGVGIEVRDRGETSPDLGLAVIRKGRKTEPHISKSFIKCRADPLSVLPEELVGQILSYLDADSLINAELVSTDWNQSASSHHVWREVFRAEFQNVCQTLTVPSANHRVWSKALKRRNWKDMWRARKALEQRWKDGRAAAIYLEGHKDSVYCVQFDEDKILTGSRDRTVRIWDAKTYECIKILGVPSRGAGSTLQPLPAEMDDRGHRPITRLFSPPCSIKPSPMPSNLYHTGSILCLQFDEQIMITGSSDCTLIIWDVKAGYRASMRLRRHTAGVLDVCFDDKHIVSCSKDATICLWDRNTGGFLRKMTGHRGPVNAVQMRGDLVVSASGDGIAKLWNIRSGLCIKEFPSRDRGMACVEFSPDSRTILAGGNDQVIYQFDTSTGELVREMRGHEGLVRSLHLDSASSRVVSGSYDTSVKAFDLRSGQTLVNFTRWTSSWILSAKSDYRRIIATSQDSRAVIMDFGYQLPGIDSLET